MKKHIRSVRNFSYTDKNGQKQVKEVDRGSNDKNKQSNDNRASYHRDFDEFIRLFK